MVSDYKILEIAQNSYTGIVFDAEDEYDTLGCHISSISHATIKIGYHITKKKNRSSFVYGFIFLR